MNQNQNKPQVGMAATICYYTDREPATVIKVTKTTVTVQVDKWTRVDSNGMSESQEYTYARDPEGKVIRFYFRPTTGRYETRGSRLSLGKRDRYHDFSF